MSGEIIVILAVGVAFAGLFLASALERKVSEAHDRKEKAVARAQLTKSGFVYVLSNVGTFGEGIVKIGMTRRMEPMDRVKELSDASVPFQFALRNGKSLPFRGEKSGQDTLVDSSMRIGLRI